VALIKKVQTESVEFTTMKEMLRESREGKEVFHLPKEHQQHKALIQFGGVEYYI
jgi:hypothetical protein